MSLHSRYTIDVDLLSDAYRISARVNVKTSGILAELNSDYSDYISLHSAYVSRLHNPGEIIGQYDQTSFHKQRINLLVIQDTREDAVLGVRQAGSIYARGRPMAGFFTVPSFEIYGSVICDMRGEPEAVFLNRPGNFQPIHNARAVASEFPTLKYTGALILINKARIGLFSLTREVAAKTAPAPIRGKNGTHHIG